MITPENLVITLAKKLHLLAETLCICGIVFGDRANFRAIEETRLRESRVDLASAARTGRSGSSMAEAKRVERPLSPHLQIYRPQLTSITSILTRITGNALIVGVALVVWWLLRRRFARIFRGGQCGDHQLVRRSGAVRIGLGSLVSLSGRASAIRISMQGMGWTSPRRPNWAGALSSGRSC